MVSFRPFRFVVSGFSTRREYFALVYPRQMFQLTLFLVILIRMFLRFIFFVILAYSTTLRYENVNKNIPRQFVCVSVTCFGKSLSRVCKLKTKSKLYALRIHQRK